MKLRKIAAMTMAVDGWYGILKRLFSPSKLCVSNLNR